MVNKNITDLILGGAIFSKDYSRDVAELDDKYFTTKNSKIIHAAIKTLYESCHPINITTVQAQIMAMGEDQNCVTETFLIAAKCSDYAPVPILIEKLKESAIRDDLKELGKYLVSSTDPIEHILEKADVDISKFSSPTQICDIGEEKSLHDAKPENKFYSGIDISCEKFNLWETELTLIAARPGEGKTTVACAIAAHVMDNYKVPVFHFSLEVSKRHIYYRNLTRITGVEFNKIRDRTMTPEEDQLVCDTFDSLKDRWKGLYYVDDITSHVDSVIQKVKELAKKRKPGIVILDYVQLFDGNGDTKAERVGDISRSLKRMAGRLSIPVIGVAQLNRMVESRSSKEPILSDLKDSGSLEQDANNVVFLWSDEDGSSWLTKAKMRSEAAGKGKIMLNKGRYQVGNVYVGNGNVPASGYGV
jgi:replicative DNA helicase